MALMVMCFFLKLFVQEYYCRFIVELPRVVVSQRTYLCNDGVLASLFQQKVDD